MSWLVKNGSFCILFISLSLTTEVFAVICNSDIWKALLEVVLGWAPGWLSHLGICLNNCLGLHPRSLTCGSLLEKPAFPSACYSAYLCSLSNK